MLKIKQVAKMVDCFLPLGGHPALHPHRMADGVFHRRPDNWVTPYIGKVYEKAGKIIPATEVVSVGIEHFDSATSMAKLAAKDPEHFKFVVGMMRK
jgi:hypothetical protein